MISEALEDTVVLEPNRRIQGFKNSIEQVISATKASAPSLYGPIDLGAELKIVLHDRLGMSHYDEPLQADASHPRWAIYQDAFELSQLFPDRNWTELGTDSAPEREESLVGSLPWADEIIQSISEILNLSDNWNSYGARRVDQNNVIFAVNEVLLPHVFARTPKPTVVPTSRGGIMLEWHTFGIDLEIEIDSPQGIYISFEDSKTGEEWEMELPSQHLDILNSVIARLSP